MANYINSHEIAGHSILEQYPSFDSKSKVADAFVSTTQITCLCCHLPPNSNIATGTQSTDSFSMRICTDCTYDDLWDHSSHRMKSSVTVLSTHAKIDIFFARRICKTRLLRLSLKPKFQEVRKLGHYQFAVKKKKMMIESDSPSCEVQNQYKLEFNNYACKYFIHSKSKLQRLNV
jgi:hypothetical protein